MAQSPPRSSGGARKLAPELSRRLPPTPRADLGEIPRLPLLDVMLLLTVATVGLLAGGLLRAPAIVAYLLAGVLVGPGVLGWVTRTHAIEQLAELGVALLLFGVGIEFALDRLRRILGRMLASGALQVATTSLVTALVFSQLGLPWPAATLVGFLVSLSSTAIVFKLYGEAGELDAPHGQAAAGIVLFQDLALVPMVLLVPMLASPDMRGAGAATSALAAAALSLGLVLLVARVVLPAALRLVARVGIPELFPLAALVLAFGTAAGAAQLGLSLPIGAFLAGLALSGSPYAHQVFSELLPLRDAFVAIFFTSIGMLVQPAMLTAEPLLLVGMVSGVLLKGALVAAIVGVLWRSARLALLTGLGLAQIGEFSFVLVREGVAAGLVGDRLEQAFLGTAILTMAATPFLIRLGRRLERLGELAPVRPTGKRLRDHVLVLGYGETGGAVARVLRETGIPFVALDMVARQVEEGRREGLPVRFGDAARRAMLEDLGAKDARAAVVALGDPTATRRAVSLLRQLNSDLLILVRVWRVREIAEIERLGADEVVPSQFETSIELFARLLTHFGVPRHVVRVQESLIRLGHYQAMRGFGPTPDLFAQTEKLIMGGILETGQVMAESEAAGRTLQELGFRQRTGAQVLNLIRDGQPVPAVDGSVRLEEGDLVVLYGPHEAIDRALRLLEPPDKPKGA
jgi:CPA2 family monovalent cation:H+ antiporter-2